MGYPSDLNNKEWEMIKHHFGVGNYGNRIKYAKRELINAVLYLLKTGCQWRMLPRDFPPYSTVHSFYRGCKERGNWENMMRELVAKDRLQSSRSANPSYAVIDSQSVKTTGAADKRGFDGGKKVKGRKRHIVVDTQGHLLHVCVHEAKTIAGCSVFQAALKKYPTIQGICADAGYRNTLEILVLDVFGRGVEICSRISFA